MYSPSCHEDDDHDDDPSYSDDFDGDFDPDVTMFENKALCNPGDAAETRHGNSAEACSTSVSGNISSPVKKFMSNNGRQLRNHKVLSSAHSCAISESRVQSVELARQYGQY